jgi:hypothetical protein
VNVPAIDLRDDCDFMVLVVFGIMADISWAIFDDRGASAIEPQPCLIGIMDGFLISSGDYNYLKKTPNAG